MGRPLNEESDVGYRASFSGLCDPGQVISGPQNPLLNDEGLDLVSSHFQVSFTSCQSLPLQRKSDH